MPTISPPDRHILNWLMQDNPFILNVETHMPAPAFNGPPIALEAGKFYRLRDMANKIYVIGANQQGIIVVEFQGGLRTYLPNGKQEGASQRNHPTDAVMEWRELVRVQLTGYQNVYSDHTVSERYATRNLANSNLDATKTRIAVIDCSREVMEGEGLYD